ncbi:MAG: hypothetical protein JWO69_1608 [Thermoleophilia bacterium]|jgi:hypothetical protein|nr:hypothetical protein [Thermoleophilia bacterium]
MSVVDRPQPFQYAMLRVVPRVERGESMNVGLVLFSRPLDFLGVRIDLDEELLARMSPGCDPAPIRAHLRGIERIVSADPDAGPIAQLSQSERFHWLVAPASTILQPSPQHTGLTTDAAATLDRLFGDLVRRVSTP